MGEEPILSQRFHFPRFLNESKTKTLLNIVQSDRRIRNR